MATIKHTRSVMPGTKPVASGMEQGEIFMNIADGIMFFRDNQETPGKFEVHSVVNTVLNVPILNGNVTIPTHNRNRASFKVALTDNATLNIANLANIQEGAGGKIIITNTADKNLTIPASGKINVGDFSGSFFNLGNITEMEYQKFDGEIYIKITGKYN